MDGNQLNGIRERLGWTQAKLAKEVGVTVTTLARWERDEVPISEPAARLVRRILAEQKAKRR